MNNYIIQGSNSPIIMEFDESMLDVSHIEVSLWDKNGNELKHWNKDELEIEENVINASLKQSETLEFPSGKLTLEVKCMKEDEIVILFEKQTFYCVERKDKTILGDL